MAATMAKDEARPGWFERIADFMSQAIGTPAAFALALSVVAVWALAGPLAGFSDTWQLVINTGTTIVTFLMVFLLGNASNRITESQDTMLANVLDEESEVESEERMIREILARIDINHIRPILAHLDEQDHQLRALEEKVLAAISAMKPRGA